MIQIELTTHISAPLERCFDLCRSIDLHMASTNWTGEKAVAGVTSGLIGADQEVTWKGRHFGLWVSHTSGITASDPPHFFQDSMVRGAFKRFCHDHYFTAQGRDGTLMGDRMEFEAPLGVLGWLAERLVLERHMRRLLHRRNQCIKRAAESGGWKGFSPFDRGQLA